MTHIWTVAGDNGISACTRLCGVYRMISGRRSPLYSRTPFARSVTWGAIQPACEPEKKA